MIDDAAKQAEQLDRGSRSIINGMVDSLLDILNQKRRECQKNEIEVQSFKVSYSAQEGRISITGLGFDKNKKEIEIGESSLPVKFFEDVVPSTESDNDENLKYLNDFIQKGLLNSKVINLPIE